MPRRCHRYAALPVLLTWALATVAPAQTTATLIVPAALDRMEANGTAFWVCSPFTARRQLLIDSRHLQPLIGKNLVAISVRRNTGLNNALSDGRLWIELAVSNSTASTLRPSTSFAANRGPDHRTCLERYVNFPATPSSTTFPAPWHAPHAVKLNFRDPVKYAGRTLVIETATHSVRPSSGHSEKTPWWVVDAQVEDARGRAALFGTSCIATMPGQPAGAEEASLTLGGTALFWLHGGKTTGPALMMLGVRSLGIDLGGLGAPGCWLYTEAVLALPVPLPQMPSGWHSQGLVTLPLPADRGLAGAALVTQWLVVALGQNGLGVGLSNGVRATLADSRDDGFTWIESTAVEAPGGRILFGRMPVLQLTFEDA